MPLLSFLVNHSYGVQSACRESEAVLQAILLNRVKKGSLGNASGGCLERDRLYACERGATESGFQKEGLERVSEKKRKGAAKSVETRVFRNFLLSVELRDGREE